MNKSHNLKVRIAESDWVTLQQRAQDAGYRTVSEYAREALLAASVVTDGGGRVPDIVVIDSSVWSRILTELTRWGTNLNQCARALNRMRQVLVRSYRDGTISRDVAERAIETASRAQASLEQAVAVRAEVWAELDAIRGSAVAFLQNSRATAGEDREDEDA